jgi:NADPH:quinone reductase-like Zn-dependent oxidoreductase
LLGSLKEAASWPGADRNTVVTLAIALVAARADAEGSSYFQDLAERNPTMRVTDLVWKLAHVSGFSLFAASAEEQATAYATVLPLIASGEIVPAHDRSFPLDRAPEALRHLIEDRPFGTVTLTVGA